MPHYNWNYDALSDITDCIKLLETVLQERERRIVLNAMLRGQNLFLIQFVSLTFL